MNLFELYEPAVPGYQDTESDKSKPQWKQSRKTKLTLKQIRKLRKMLDVRNYEKQHTLKRVHDQYAPKPEGGEGAPTL
jgi:hypothetical protein